MTGGGCSVFEVRLARVGGVSMGSREGADKEAWVWRPQGEPR